MEDVEVLLVEDNADEAKLTMRALAKNKITKKVIWVKDGEEAEDCLLARGAYAQRNADNKPKVIFLDLKLPKVNGSEFLKRIKENPETSSIPVVALTASQEPTDLIFCYENGVNSYIVKPVNFDHFTKLINDIGSYWVKVNQSPLS